MKNFKSILALVIGMIIFASTSPLAQAFEWVSPTSLSYGSPSTGTQTFKIDCGTFDSPWDLSTDVSWISVNQLDGVGTSIIEVTVLNNESFDQSRSVYITVTIYPTPTTPQVIKVLINQVASTPTLTLSTTSINLSSSPAFSFTSDNNWTAIMDSWLGLTSQVQPQSNFRITAGDITSGSAGTTNLNVVAVPNPTTTSRTGTITFTSGSVSKTLTVTQDGATVTPTNYMYVSVSTLTFKYNEYENIVEVKSNTDWNITVDNNVSWLDLPSVSGYGDQDVLVRIMEANTTSMDRTATITFTSESGPKTLTVTQKAQPVTTSILGGASTDDADFMVYPNPANGVFHVKANNVRAINIFNDMGNVTTSESIEQDQTFQLESGFYFVEVITTNGSRSVKKVIVN